MNSSLLLFAAAAAAFVAVSGSAVYPVHHAPVTTQYHSQDELGQYSYGYSGGPSAKHEQRTADGVTRGGYSYVDANGIVQSLAYVSDPVNGFRVSGTNLPVDTVAAPHPVPVVAPAAPVHSYAVAPAAPVHSYAVAPAAPVHSYAVAPAVPSVVDARHLAVPYAAAVPYAHPLHKIAQPLTPAGTSNLHYPEHAVLLARRKRSAGLYPYPLVSSYAAPAPPAHVVTVKHAEYAAPPAPVVHHVAAPSYVIAAPAPAVATSYTSVVRHDSPAVAYAAPAPVYNHYAPAPVLAPVVKHYAAPAPAPVLAPVVKHYAAAAAPAPVLAPVAVPAPHVYAAPDVAVAPVKTQFHTQDEHGQYTYGYTDGASAKTETRYADGVTKGSYSYVDDTGSVQAVHYTAGADGFKAAGTNIPVHHV